MKTGLRIMAGALVLGAAAAAQDIDPASDTARFALDTGLFMVSGFAAILFVFALGLRDVGLARVQNAPAVCLRTIGLIAVAVFAFWLTGYNLIYSIEPGGLLGEFQIWAPGDEDPRTAGRADGAFWFFQLGLAAIPAAIVASAVSERVRLWPFLVYAAVLTGLIYPIVGSWAWGGGYLAEAWRFVDLGGGAVVHITGGAAALAAALVVGPRPGRYRDGASRPAPTTALPLAAFAAGLALISWTMVLAGMTGSASSIEAAISIGVIIVNAVLAAAGGIITALFLTQIVYRRSGLVTSISAAIAGLVAISADPAHPALWQAAMIGAVGGMIVTVTPPFLDRFRIDDAGFTVPAHLICGVWGVAIVPWSNPGAWLPGQLLGIAVIGLFAFVVSLLLWIALKYTFGVRQRPDGLGGGAPD